MLHVAHPHEVERRRGARGVDGPDGSGVSWQRALCLMENTVEILGLRQELPRQPGGQIFTHEGYPEIAVVDLGRATGRDNVRGDVRKILTSGARGELAIIAQRPI